MTRTLSWVVPDTAIEARARARVGESESETHMQQIRQPALGALALALIAAACTGGETPTGEARVSPPNILLVVTDDQRYGTLGVMPSTRRLFVRGGTRFTQAFATTPQCCPSRASILTGRYAHNHGVLSNAHAEVLDEDTTVQRYLRDAGYRTAIVGKYLNYPGDKYNRAHTAIDPAHFDEWATFLGRYRKPLFNIGGDLEKIDGYSTDIVGRRAVAMLRDLARRGDPWFLYVAPFAPHPPARPAARHAASPVPRWHGNPAVRERDRSDKPTYVRAGRGETHGRRDRRRQLRSLRSVDDLVERIFRVLRAVGEDRDTVAIFMSDNGFLWGEHGATRKGPPYTGSVRVPLLVRWPGRVEAGATDDRLVANIDVAPTILDAAAVRPGEPLDGRSLLGAATRDRILLEHAGLEKLGMPAWASSRTRSYHYVELYDRRGHVVEREYYDLASDPWQLRNLLGDRDSSNDPDVDALGAQLEEDVGCRGRSCP